MIRFEYNLSEQPVFVSNQLFQVSQAPILPVITFLIFSQDWVVFETFPTILFGGRLIVTNNVKWNLDQKNLLLPQPDWTIFHVSKDLVLLELSDNLEGLSPKYDFYYFLKYTKWSMKFHNLQYWKLPIFRLNCRYRCRNIFG